MTDRITITATAEGYVATFHEDPEILELFGTDTIPTAWTARTSPDVVLENVRRLNPCAVVELAAGELVTA